MLTVFFDLSRIASLGAFFYLVMDILIHWGVYKNLRQVIGAKGGILLTAIALDTVVLGVSGAMKLPSDPAIVGSAISGMAIVFAFERWYLSGWTAEGKHQSHSKH